MDDLPKLWAEIKADLCRARDLLPTDQRKPDLLDEFLEHNELGLACDVLEESAHDLAVSSEFWLALRDAAKKMQLEEDAVRYEKHAEKP